jgi:hypothetical protein
MHRSPSCGKVRIPADCAHCVLDATSFQPTPAKVLILRKPRLEWGRTNGFLNRGVGCPQYLREFHPPNSRNLSLPKLTLHCPQSRSFADTREK